MRILNKIIDLEITGDDIIIAEQKLGIVGMFTLDTENDSKKITKAKIERIEFIKNLKTLDLNAVPGSGKTTALLMKLVILESKMPFYNGSGILVISHTNTAIDEIRNKLEKISPKLFMYPNFIGTIQSFVNKFLAIPYYINQYNKKPYSIDDVIYNDKVQKYSKNIFNGWIAANGGVDFLKQIRFDKHKNLIGKINSTSDKFRLKNKNASAYKTLVTMKENLMSYGYLHYDDAYFLADSYLDQSSVVSNILQKRFKFIFVDEMQDMDKHQVTVLEKIFFHNNSVSFYQRIGDKNQAIHNKVDSLDSWNVRSVSLSFNGSFRLNQNISTVVENFALESQKIDGLKENYKYNEKDIKPHILVYNDGEEEKVIEKYIKIIQGYNLENNLNKKYLEKNNYPFYVLGWNTDWKEYTAADEKKELGEKGEINYDKKVLKSYFKNFDKRLGKESQKKESLDDYFKLFDNNSINSKSIINLILEISMKIFRLEDIMNGITKKEIKEIFFNDNMLKNKILKIIKEKKAERNTCIRKFIGIEIKEKFFKKKYNTKTMNFLEKSSKQPQPNTRSDEVNIYKYNDTKVKLSTVHSVKGTENIATLYLETFFQGNYEIDKLKKQFFGSKFLINPKKPEVYNKQTIKMLYVGFSRATHLLCFAINSKRYKDEDRGLFEKAGWVVKKI